MVRRTGRAILRYRRGVAATWAALALVLGPSASSAAEVTVEIRNVESAHGRVLVALCTPETFLQPRCPYSGAIDASPGSAAVVIHGVPPGIYAVQAFHDADGDGEIDRSFFGRPTEGIGFGNDAAMRFGPPEFADAAVTVTEPAVATFLSLRYLSRR